MFDMCGWACLGNPDVLGDSGPRGPPDRRSFKMERRTADHTGTAGLPRQGWAICTSGQRSCRAAGKDWAALAAPRVMCRAVYRHRCHVPLPRSHADVESLRKKRECRVDAAWMPRGRRSPHNQRWASAGGDHGKFFFPLCMVALMWLFTIIFFAPTRSTRSTSPTALMVDSLAYGSMVNSIADPLARALAFGSLVDLLASGSLIDSLAYGSMVRLLALTRSPSPSAR
ncbi:hypothetical protein B0H19DRAFT_1272944 [Mycena capillaripes]|nr:hypothetical protein B0H19DRAFT_1272944 [Mycena capillaripes]